MFSSKSSTISSSSRFPFAVVGEENEKDDRIRSQKYIGVSSSSSCGKEEAEEEDEVRAEEKKTTTTSGGNSSKKRQADSAELPQFFKVLLGTHFGENIKIKQFIKEASVSEISKTLPHRRVRIVLRSVLDVKHISKEAIAMLNCAVCCFVFHLLERFGATQNETHRTLTEYDICETILFTPQFIFLTECHSVFSLILDMIPQSGVWNSDSITGVSANETSVKEENSSTVSTSDPASQEEEKTFMVTYVPEDFLELLQAKFGNLELSASEVFGQEANSNSADPIEELKSNLSATTAAEEDETQKR